MSLLFKRHKTKIDKLPIEDGIDVIFRSLSFKRFLLHHSLIKMLVLLQIMTAIIRKQLNDIQSMQ